MIPYNELSILKPATELIEVAKSSIVEGQLQCIAYMLNTNANVGTTSIEYVGNLLDETIQKLKDNGYEVRPVIDSIGPVYVIKALDSKE